MDPVKKGPAIETLAPSRNFHIPLAARVGAAGGPYAYMRRKREIEDLEEALVRAAAEILHAAQGNAAAVAEGTRKRKLEAVLARRNTLVETHNRYYPTEANLPLDYRTGQMLERGAPWVPLDPWTLPAVFERARRAR